MGLVSSETVRRCLRGLSEERFVAFVSTLWAARGAETTVVEGPGLPVVEARHSGRTRRLGVVTGRWVPSGTEGVDVLVLARPASTVRGTDAFAGRLVDSDDLHAMLLYAVPRTAADDVCRRFFDRPLAEERDPSPTLTAPSPEHSVSLVVGLLGLSLLVASVFGGPILYGETAPVFGAPASDGGDAADVTPTDPTAEDTSGTESPSAASSFQSTTYPPGLGAGGVVDHDAIADAHANAVTGQSYRLTITHREYVEGVPSAYRRETVFVAEPTVYRTELEGAGNLERGSLVVAGVEAYADGERRYQRRVVADEFDRSYTVETDTVRGVRNGEGRYADRVEQYVDWFLSVSDSAIVDSFERDGVRYYWLRLGADPYAGVENSTGSALIDENGVVHEVRREYDYPGGEGVSAAVSIRYTDVGTTTVSPPGWYEERVGTEGTTANATTMPTTGTGDETATPATGAANETETPVATRTPTRTGGDGGY
jgi:hypothetical protein